MKHKQEQEFEALSGIQQCLLRPQMWIGSMSPITQKMFMLDQGGAKLKEVTYIPAFRKIIDEILDNSCDALVKLNNAKGKVKVVIDEGWVYIEDNGPGIPVIRKDIKDITDNRMSDEEKRRISETYLPEIAWTRLFSGSNFKDSDNKTTVGSHGLGSKCTSIFSRKFVGISDDGKKLCKVVAKNNLETVETVVSESKERGVRIKFVPDFKRFGMEKIEPVYVELMRQRLICLGITFPGIKFSLNGKQVNVNDKAFLNLFSEHITFQVFDRGFIGVYPNETDEFNFFTYVDGLSLNRGGNHIDYIVEKLVTPVREKLVKKFKNIKPGDIKNKLSLVVFLRDFPNLKFDSQTKETLTNLPSEITKYFGDSVDWEKFAKNIIKNEYILDPIVETFKLKEEVKERVALKQAGKSKVKISVDKYIKPIGGNDYLMVCEGLCLDDEQEVFILNENKHVPIRDVKIGDLVLTHNQNIKPVVDVTHKISECVKIKTKSGKEIICSKKHRFFVYDTKTGSWRFKRVCDMDITRDRLVNNKLAAGFIFRDFTISPSDESVQDKKYKYVINLGDEDVYSTENHKFTIFNTETNTFELLPAKKLNGKTMKIVMVFSPSRSK